MRVLVGEDPDAPPVLVEEGEVYFLKLLVIQEFIYLTLSIKYKFLSLLFFF